MVERIVWFHHSSEIDHNKRPSIFEKMFNRVVYGREEGMNFYQKQWEDMKGIRNHVHHLSEIGQKQAHISMARDITTASTQAYSSNSSESSSYIPVKNYSLCNVSRKNSLESTLSSGSSWSKDSLISSRSTTDFSSTTAVNVHALQQSSRKREGFLGLRISEGPPHMVAEIIDLVDVRFVSPGMLGYANEDILVGDLILSIDGHDVANTSLAELHAQLQGELYTSVQLTLRRSESGVVYTVRVMRHRYHEFAPTDAIRLSCTSSPIEDILDTVWDADDDGEQKKSSTQSEVESNDSNDDDNEKAFASAIKVMMSRKTFCPNTGDGGQSLEKKTLPAVAMTTGEETPAASNAATAEASCDVSRIPLCRKLNQFRQSMVRCTCFSAKL
jgi:hypothetical protein